MGLGIGRRLPICFAAYVGEATKVIGHADRRGTAARLFAPAIGDEGPAQP